MGHRAAPASRVAPAPAAPQSSATPGPQPPDAALEAEAERVAARVLRGEAADTMPGEPPLPLGPRRPGSGSLPAVARAALAAPGRPLDAATRAEMEARLGHDLRPVRLHEDAAAATAARVLRAEAFTHGTDLVFARGAFRPASAEGRALLAHELAHVVQQAAGPAPALQRRPQASPSTAPTPATAASPSIVMIIAAHGTLEGAMATLADGRVEPVVLTENGLDPGEYVFQQDDSPSHYRKLAGVPGQGFLWRQPKRYVFAPTVRVLVRQSAAEKIAALPAHIRDFLTTTRSRAEQASAQDMESIATAGRILELYGVTADELSLRELAAADAEAVGRPVEASGDMVGWALSFVEGREAARTEASGNRATLREAAARLEAVAVRGSSSWRQDPAADSFMQALDREVAAMAAALLNAVEAAIYRTDRRFIGAYQPEHPGPGYVWDAVQALRGDREIIDARERLRREEAWTPPRAPESDAAAEREARERGYTVDPWYSREHVRQHEARLRVNRQDLLQLIEQKSRPATGEGPPRLEIGALRSASAERLLAAGTPGEAYGALRGILFRGRVAVRDARRRLDDSRALYGADLVLAAEKAALGARPGSTLAWLIDEVAKERTRKRIWEEILTVVGLVVAFIPGPFGLLLRSALATIETVRAVGQQAEAETLHAAGLHSTAPEGGLAGTLVITAAGVVLDLATTRLPARAPLRPDLGEAVPPPGLHAPEPAPGGSVPDPVPSTDVAPPTEMRGVPGEQGVTIRPAATAATLTRAEEAALRNTEATLTGRRAGLLRDQARAQQASDGLASEIARREDLLEAGTLRPDGVTRVEDELAGLRRRWDAQQAELDRVGAELGTLDDELAHVQEQIRSTITSEQVFAEIERELEGVPVAPRARQPNEPTGFESPRPLPGPSGAPELAAPGGRPLRESAGARRPGGSFQSASASDPAAMATAIRADVAEASAYKWALDEGEIGLARPTGANREGGDFITAIDGPDGVEILVTDTKSSIRADFPSPAGPEVPPAWMDEVRAATRQGRLDLGDAALEARIRAALEATPPRVRVRQLNVDYSPAGGGRIFDPTLAGG